MGPIAANDEAVIQQGKAEDLFVRGGCRQGVSQRQRIVAPMPQQMSGFGRHVMVE